MTREKEPKNCAMMVKRGNHHDGGYAAVSEDVFSDTNDFKYIDIPEAFHSRETGRPFEECLVCGRQLRGGDVVYMIEKAYRGGETLYDYAVCLDCYLDLVENLSHASLTAIEGYFAERVDFELRQIEMMAIAPHRVEPWIDHCVVTRAPIGREDEYQAFAVCQGSQLILGYYPYAVCEAVVEELYPLLSKQTRDEIDRFTRDYLGLPPELLRDPHNLHVFV
jgi:hypothetical protein